MGNSSRRPASQPTGTAATSISRGGLLTSFTKLSHQKLAPKQVISDGDLECPICFVSYSEYNTSVCCRQCICTECYIQMQGSSNLSCPFCGRDGFNVAYDPTPNVSVKSVAKDGENAPADPPIATRSASTSTLTSSPSTYVTPEQDKKLRSTSFDISGTPVSSKADREALEAEIRRQRTDIEFEFLSQETRHNPNPTQRSASTGNRSWHSSTSNSTSRNRQNDLHRFNSTEYPRSQSQQHPQPRRRESENRSRSTIPSPAETNPSVPPMPPSPYLHQQQFLIDDEEVENSDFLTDDDAQLIAALQSILNGSEAVAVNLSVPSLEDLEEMMVLEAIRQSLREAENATNNMVTTDETAGDSSTAVDERSNAPLVSAMGPSLEDSSTSVSIPLSSPPSEESSSRLLEDVESALNTPPRPRQQGSNFSS